MQRRIRTRALLLGGLTALLFVALICRLYYVQIVNGDELVELAKGNWETSKTIMAVRGAITDRHDEALVYDAPSFTVAISPYEIHKENQADNVIRTLAPILDMDEGKLKALVNKKRSNGKYYGQVEVRNEGWQIDAVLADKVRKAVEDRGLKKCVFLLEGKKRFYPFQQMSSHVLGYLHKEGGAVGGLELKFNEFLQGKPGSVQYERDAKGIELPSGKVTILPAENGNIVRTTIDRHIQQFVEQALDKANSVYRPKSMTAIVLDPQTMEVLAISNRPTYNPNEYWETEDQANFFNHALGSRYEPGSSFKIVTLAAAIEEGLFDENETFMSGVIPVPGTKIRDHNKRGWGEITYKEGLQRSSNVAFVKLGYERLGEARLRDYIDRFGFNEKTKIDMGGEMSGSVKFKYPSEVATATFGQGGVFVTPVQQAVAFAVAANGGKLMRPYIVKEVVDPASGKVIKSFGPKVVRQVISAKTAQKVSELLETVVNDPEKGTGKNAAINGYRVAGKTGTAQKVVDGQYSSDKWVLSFIGYAPVENPRILCAIIIDEPDTGGSYMGGGTVAAPIFKDIMSKSLLYLGVKAEGGKVVVARPDPRKTAPDVTGMTLDKAQLRLTKSGVQAVVLGSGSSVIQQYPRSGAVLGPEQPVYLLTGKASAAMLPDMKDKSLRDVMEMCSIFQAPCRIQGEGYVQEQTIIERGPEKLMFFSLKPLSAVWDPLPVASPEVSPAPDGAADDPAAEISPRTSGESDADSSGNGRDATDEPQADRTPEPELTPEPEKSPEPEAEQAVEEERKKERILLE